MKTSHKILPFEKIFPLMSVRDGVIVSRRGDITLGWKVELFPAFSCDATDYEDLLQTMASAVRSLAAGIVIGGQEAWVMIHRQDVFLKEKYEADHVDGFLGSSYENHFAGREYLSHDQYVYVTLCSKSSALGKGSSSGLLGGLPSSVLFDRVAVDSFVNKAREFMSIAFSRFSVRELSDDDLLGDSSSAGLIQSVFMLGDRGPVLSDVVFDASSVQVGEKKLFAYSVNDADRMPGSVRSVRKIDSLSGLNSEVLLSFGSSVGIGLDCEHIVNHYILVPPQLVVLNELETKRRNMFSMSKGSAENRVNAEGIQEFIDRVHSDQLFVVYSHVNVLAWSSEEDASKVKSQVGSALSSMGVIAVQDLVDTPVLWYSAIPGAACEIGSDNLMIMELKSALCFSAVDTFQAGFEGGMFKISDRLRHIPLRLDTQELAYKKRLIDNYNAFILGPSGSGKSFFTNLYVRNCYDSGSQVFIIDVGDSYQGLCSIIKEESGGIDGQYLTWEDDNPFTFNPFVDYRNWVKPDGTVELNSEGIDFFLSLLKGMWVPAGGWNSGAENCLVSFVERFVYNYLNSHECDEELPVFDDFFSFIEMEIALMIKDDRCSSARFKEEAVVGVDDSGNKTYAGYWLGNTRITEKSFDIDEFKKALSSYSLNGRFGFLLNERNPKDLLNSRFVVFEVRKISSVKDSTFYSLCIFCIVNAFDRKMRSNDGFKVMVIEEAWKAISNESMAPYLRELWKTSRKYSTSATVVTQEINDIMASDVIKDAIIQNSAIKVLLEQTKNVEVLKEIVSYLGLNDKDRSQLMSINRGVQPGAKYREVFISLGGSYSGVFATEVSREEAWAYESEYEKKKPMLALSEKLCSSVSAIKQLVGENH